MAELSSVQEANEEEDPQRQETINNLAVETEEPYQVVADRIKESESDEIEDSNSQGLDGRLVIVHSELEAEIDNAAALLRQGSTMDHSIDHEKGTIFTSSKEGSSSSSDIGLTLMKHASLPFDDARTPPGENNCGVDLLPHTTATLGVVRSQQPPTNNMNASVHEPTRDANTPSTCSDEPINILDCSTKRFLLTSTRDEENNQRTEEENQLIDAATTLSNMAPNARPTLLAQHLAIQEAPVEQVPTHQEPSPASFVSDIPTFEFDQSLMTMRPTTPNPSNVMLHMTLQQHQQTLQNSMQSAYGYPGMPPLPGSGRRKILLKLQEDRPQDKKGFFFRRKSSRSFLYNNNSDFQVASPATEGIPRGQITVSWFEGTTSKELQEHVLNSVSRKMGHAQLTDLRILDETVDPPEEIVLSPFIPDGSEFLLRFNAKAAAEQRIEQGLGKEASISVPQSPSAAPSPFPSTFDLGKLNAQLLARGLEAPLTRRNPSVSADDANHEDTIGLRKPKDHDGETASQASRHDEDDVMGYSAEDQVEHRLRQLADLLLHGKKNHRRTAEKRQVIFVLANYFILFLSMVAAFAEIQARAPSWLNWVETQMESVQQCAMDQEALFECVQRGDFYGLIASFVLWLSRSAATKQFFLFGFKSPQALWTVVYESVITGFCWGISYMLIRRGLNPDTRKDFLKKYWKDCVYGSLAGFNASFMKQVLKNLIPQEALEEAMKETLLQERQLKIFNWIPTFFKLN